MASAQFAVGAARYWPPRAGPGSVAAVYHFGDRTPPCTVAAFADADAEGAAEHETARLAH